MLYTGTAKEKVPVRLKIDKLIFPRLERDQRRRAMNELFAIALVTLSVGCVVVGAILLMNYRRW